MEKRLMERLRKAVHAHLLPRRHSALLFSIIAVLAVRPLIEIEKIGSVVFSLAVLVVLLVALYTIQVDELVGERAALLVERRRRQVIGWVLGLAATTGRLATFSTPSRPLYLASSICWLLFFCFVTWTELRGVMRQREVTSETIHMSISVYLLLGMTWGLFYVVVYELQPQAFHFGGPLKVPWVQPGDTQSVFLTLLYFSFTTLATIGYGDITPVTMQARTAAIAEGITGQLYLAILVARLVGMHMGRSIGLPKERQACGFERSESARQE